MKIKRIILDNIRSYKHQEVDFPDGTTLLSGDIGSGKTSILMGIEFALFGLQPGQKGSSILRNGEDEGGVAILIEIDEKEIFIERTLKRGRSVSQDYCAITIDNHKEEISVMELKSRVLSLLNYPKEFSKKQNILYKFTVYTPQEEMKQIILQDSETRINTLRHVFGIDKYKKIIENISIVSAKIREERRVKEALTSELEKSKEELLSKEEESEAKHYNLSSVEKELFLKKENRKKTQEEKEEISKKIDEKRKFQQEVEKTKILISTKNDTILDNIRAIDQLKIQVNELEYLNFDESQISILEEEISFKKKENEDFGEKNMEINFQINHLNLKNEDNESVKKKLLHIEMCPTCLQNVDPVYKSNVSNKLDENISENVKQIQTLTIEKLKVSERISKLSYEISFGEKQIQDLRMLKIKFQNLQEKKKRIDEIGNSNIIIEKDMSLLNKHMDSLKISVFELSKFDRAFEIKIEELGKALEEERYAEIKVAELKKEIEVFSIYIEELREKINKTKRIKEELNYLIKLEDWLSKRFIPVISFIEKNVMVKLKTQFSKLFSEWFGMLVSESFNVWLRDDFTPVIEQQDYEIDYAYLSGGERTAIALAYRLALNQIINSLMSKIKTKDLIILDEPTDGFSEQQLDKMRDVLYQLNVKQMIIVSHEQKIEGFVENLIRFKKENGVSTKSE